MNKEALKEILFQGRELEKKYKSLSTKHRSPESNCLLGSLELNRKDMMRGSSGIGNPNFQQKQGIKKFQIVQLKKYKPIQQKQKKNDEYRCAESYSTQSTKSELVTPQVNSHRGAPRAQTVEQAHLGMLEKSLGMKYTQKPLYYFEGDLIKNVHIGELGIKGFQGKRLIEHERSFLNIQSLAEKFIPESSTGPNFVSPNEYKKICKEQKKKIMREKSKAIRKGLTLDFLSQMANFRQSGIGAEETPEVQFSLQDQQLQSSELEKGHKPLKGNDSQSGSKDECKKGYCSSMSMNRVSSLNGTPKKSLAKRMFDEQKQFQEKIEQQKREALEIRKQVNKNYAKPFSPPENISATAYIVYEIAKKQSKFRKSIKISTEKRKYAANGHKVLVELNSRTPVEVASLTKVMTFVVALQICESEKIDASTEKVKIGYFQQNISGTTANIKKGEIYTLQQLYYGLMLPSGNDASLAIAVWGGKTLLKKREDYDSLISDLNLIKRKKLYYDRFLEEMNLKASELNLEKTKYANSHGLMNFDNKSCPFDLAVLCEYALKKDTFKRVINTKRYECEVISVKQGSESPRTTKMQRSSSKAGFVEDQKEMRDFYANQVNSSGEDEKQILAEEVESELIANSTQMQTQKYFKNSVSWENTHGLIHDNRFYKGIKTGITNAAGPCLSSYLQVSKREFIIIVLNCKSMKQRYKDTENLRKWTFDKESISQNS